MVEPLRHRQTKGAGTDMLSLTSPRHTSTLRLAVSRRGSYRLARLAAKFGPEISLRDLTDRFSYDCMWRAEAHGRKGKSACGVYLPDLEQPRPPDVPPGMVKLRLIKSG